RLRAREMRTPVWNYAIGTVGYVAPAAVSHDRMIRIPRVIGSLLTASTNRSLGSSVSTLFGIRFSGLTAGSAIRSGLVDAYIEVKRCGVLTRAAPMRPIQPVANLLPRCGVEINITR